MGAWGHGIEEHDTVLDVLDQFVEILKQTQDLAATSAAVAESWRESLADQNSAVMVRIGMALAQWRYGALDPELLVAVRQDLEQRRGIDDYSDPPAREKVMRNFLVRLGKPNPKPRALPKPPKTPKRPRKPKDSAFAAGDCLVLRLPAGRFAAALVLVADRDSDGDGFNVIARLQWNERRPPELHDFALLSSGPIARNLPLATIEIAMFGHAPYNGRIAVERLGRITVDPTLFPIRKSEDWYWESTRAENLRMGLVWKPWDLLAGMLV